MNGENQELIRLNFYKFISFNDTIKSKRNGIADDKLVRPAIPCRNCFWPAARKVSDHWFSSIAMKMCFAKLAYNVLNMIHDILKLILFWVKFQILC